MRARFDAMRAAATLEPAPDAAVRRERLRQLASLVRDHRVEIAAAISADFGHRATEETDLLEVFPTLSGIAHARRRLRGWMRARGRWAGLWFLPARTRVRPQPLGVVGIIVPWNYPLYLAAGPLTDALAAGNRVMLKTSEYTPRFSALLESLVARVFDPRVVCVVGGAVEAARAFSSLPFDHLLFTGSTAVGHEVMRAAAENLTPVTLELGGKSPALVGPDARFEHAVRRIVLGKLLNAGQTCIAPDYVLLPRERIDEFVACARAAVTRLYPSLGSNTQYSAIANDRQHARLQALLDDATAAGARVEPLADAPVHPRGFTPMLLCGTHDGMRVMREEIFGPILPIVPYDSFEAAIAYVNARPHPLALYVFDENRARVEQVLASTTAGGVSVNDTLLHIAQHGLPFGGVGPSGMGAYHGVSGFRTFSRMKPVFSQSRFSLVGLLDPPYGRIYHRMIALLLGR